MGAQAICVPAFLSFSACLSRGGAGEAVCALSHRLCTFTDVVPALEICMSGGAQVSLECEEITSQKTNLSRTHPFPSSFLAIKIVRKRCCYRQPLSTDGVNGLITPLLINEWEKCFQCQPVPWVSPIPHGAVTVVQPLASSQPTAVPGIYPKSCGSGNFPQTRVCSILRVRAHREEAPCR